LVQFDHDQITDIPEPVPVHLWLDHTINTCNRYTIIIESLSLIDLTGSPQTRNKNFPSVPGFLQSLKLHLSTGYRNKK